VAILTLHIVSMVHANITSWGGMAYGSSLSVVKMAGNRTTTSKATSFVLRPTISHSANCNESYGSR